MNQEPPPRLRTVLIGYGRWGRNIYRAIRACTHLVAVCEINKECTRIFEGCENLKLYRTVSELLDDAALGQVDLFFVATPPHTHYAITMSLLAKFPSPTHVFVEKPMCTSADDANSLACGPFASRVFVGHVMLFNRAMQTAMQYIQNNIVEYAEVANASNPAPENIHILMERGGPNPTGSVEDLILDLAPHDLSVMLHMFPQGPRLVSATANGTHASANYRYDHVGLGVSVFITMRWSTSYAKKRSRMEAFYETARKCVVFDDNESQVADKVYVLNVDTSHQHTLWHDSYVWAPPLTAEVSACVNAVQSAKAGKQDVNGAGVCRTQVIDSRRGQIVCQYLGDIVAQCVVK